MPSLQVTREQVLRFRARAMHLDKRLAAGSLSEAVWGGLQDTAPRAAQLSLHARVEGVTPTAWEDPSLVQLWGPRLAVYLVLREDVAVFTLGRLPRDEAKRKSMEHVAEEAHRFLVGEAKRVRHVFEALSPDKDANRLRAAGATGKLLLRWDARDTLVLPAWAPAVDADKARVELGRRFLHWCGPGTVEQFARWAGVERKDAQATWALLEPEVTPVEYAKRPGLVLAADEEALVKDEQTEGVRLLPFGDPYLYADHDLLAPDASKRDELWAPPAKLPKLPDGTSYMPGAILANGEIVGIWGRQQGRVAIKHWLSLSTEMAQAVTAEAESFGQALGLRVRLEWVKG